MGSDRRLPHLSPPKPYNRSPTSLPSIILAVSLAILAAFPRLSVAESLSADDPSRFHDFYTAHCAGEVFSEYPISATAPSSNDSLSGKLRFSGFFAFAAAKADDPGDTSSSARSSFMFYPKVVYGTNNKDVLKVVGSLRLFGRGLSLNRGGGSGRRRLKTAFHVRGPKIPVRRGRYRFSLTGYAAESTGRLCMVGSSFRFGNVSSSDVLLKVRYPVKMSINSSFVRGELESLGDQDGKGKVFGRVSLLGFSGRTDYGYSLMEKEKDGSFDRFDNGDGDNLSMDEIHGRGVGGWCSAFGWLSSYEMEYGRGCDAVNCNPLGKEALFVPDRISLSMLQCSDQGKLQFSLSFRNSSSYSGYAFNPRSSLLGEGDWDPKAKRICGVACHILNYMESLADTFVGDCSIKMCMRFPATFSVINRSPVVGQIWSTKAMDDLGYFPKIVFRSYGPSYANRMYKYGVMGGTHDLCDKNTKVPNKKVYPFPSSTDMRFDVMVTNSKGHTAHGEAVPLFVGGSPHQSSFYGSQINGNQTWSPFHPNISGVMQNMSYSVSFSTPDNYSFSGMNLSHTIVDVFAEGVYNGLTGHLCMIGCRRVLRNDKLFTNSSLDCKVTINVQFPPLNRKRGEMITGFIKSTRLTSDPLYFETLTLKSNSMYSVQATESIWRMDLEIVLVVISNTLACVFVVSQILHVRWKPDVLPFISVVMLTVVMLGHMIPLLLNFEALFVGNHYQQSSLWRNGGWLEVKEVVVRAVTMVAFLLELRLLQLTWSARQGDVNKGILWVSEKKVAYASFLLYAFGAVVAWLMHQSTHTVSYHVLQPGRMLRSMDTVYPVNSYQSHSLWEDLKSYAGLILDGFLLPQILLNLFMDSNEKALSSFFYFGTTFVRLLPHTYDLYRAHSSSWSPEFSYIYASHRMDYYSTAWNIIIPCSGMLFVLIVYLQQRFNGRCILPKRFRARVAYTKVPAVTNDDL